MIPSFGPSPGAILLAAQALPSMESGLRLAWRSLLDLWASVIARTPHMNFAVYCWTGSQQANVLRVSDRVATRIKLALDEAGIEIPYPRTVVFLRGGGTDEGEAPR
ncbi:MAG: mechanosensitive ion channel family protein [Gemmatimonadota bacterium]|nr:mechanosensitive ion channel family protein [Gemmatimonadota bacterium]